MSVVVTLETSSGRSLEYRGARYVWERRCRLRGASRAGRSRGRRSAGLVAAAAAAIADRLVPGFSTTNSRLESVGGWATWTGWSKPVESLGATQAAAQETRPPANQVRCAGVHAFHIGTLRQRVHRSAALISVGRRFESSPARPSPSPAIRRGTGEGERQGRRGLRTPRSGGGAHGGRRRMRPPRLPVAVAAGRRTTG